MQWNQVLRSWIISKHDSRKKIKEHTNHVAKPTTWVSWLREIRNNGIKRKPRELRVLMITYLI